MPVLDPYLKALRDSHAESLLLRAGEVPVWRVAGALVPNGDPLPSGTRFEELLLDLAAANGLADRFREEPTLEFTHDGDGLRIRVQIVREARGVGAVLRRAPDRPDPATLTLPSALVRATNAVRGLVLLSGACGAGRTTALAALIDGINRSQQRYVIVIDRKIEFTHDSQQSLVHQLTIGAHAATYAAAIETGIRAGAGVIGVAEIDSSECATAIAGALDANTLVIAAIAAHGVTDALDRLLRLLPREAHGYERSCVTDGLAVAAHLQAAPARNGDTVTLVELAEGTSDVRALMREDRVHELEDHLASPRAAGVRCLEAALAECVRDGRLARDEAFRYARRRSRLERELGVS